MDPLDSKKITSKHNLNKTFKKLNECLQEIEAFKDTYRIIQDSDLRNKIDSDMKYKVQDARNAMVDYLYDDSKKD